VCEQAGMRAKAVEFLLEHLVYFFLPCSPLDWHLFLPAVPYTYFFKFLLLFRTSDKAFFMGTTCVAGGWEKGSRFWL